MIIKRDKNYRVWDRKNKVMIYSFEYSEPYEFFEMPAYDRDDIMENIGMRDKNNVDIYEGDIVKYTISYPNFAGEETITPVVYMNSVYLEAECGFYPFMKSNGGLPAARTVEVVGNIYNNPELVKESSRWMLDKFWVKYEI